MIEMSVLLAWTATLALRPIVTTVVDPHFHCSEAYATSNLLRYSLKMHSFCWPSEFEPRFRICTITSRMLLEPAQISFLKSPPRTGDEFLTCAAQLTKVFDSWPVGGCWDPDKLACYVYSSRKCHFDQRYLTFWPTSFSMKLLWCGYQNSFAM